ncbi:hypothetical protein VPH35_020029 [Triticum aestivum]
MAITTTNDAAAPTHAANSTGNQAGRDHVVLFPFMAKGHTPPLLHFTRALTEHQKNLRITMIVTPANLAFARSRLPASVRLAVLPFPSLPPLPSGFMASLPAPPLVLISDFFLGFTHRIAADAGIRRIVFHNMSCFSMATCKSLMPSPPPSSAQHGASFHVSRMSEYVRIMATDVPNTIAKIADAEDPVTRFLINDIDDSDGHNWGVLVNSFAMLEEYYVSAFMLFYQPDARAWLAGPLFLAAGDMPEHVEEQDPKGCLAWLDEMAERSESVIYVSFGTQAHVSDEQLDELALGMVRSGHPFLWAVRSGTWSPLVDAGPHGRIVRRWIPQRSVLAC